MSSSVSDSRQSFETSKPRFCFAPDVRTYISFSIDLRQTLDLLRCDVSEEFEALTYNFPVRKYVAVVQDYPDVPIPDVPYQRMTLRLLQQGLPEPIPRICLEPHMCFPVAPETSHPLNRSPVKTNKPLPWKGCYHLSCLDAEVCLPQSHFDYAKAISMDFDDWLRTYRYCGEDAEFARTNQGKSQPGWPSWIPFEPNECPIPDSADESPAEDEVKECSDFPAPLLPSEPLEPKEYKYFADGTIDWFSTEYGDDNGVEEEPYEESGDDSDGYSESIRWFSDDEDAEEDEGSKDADETIPSMNAMLGAMMPFDGYMPDGSILPVINFSPNLSGIASLFSAEQFFRDFKAAKALLKECVEGPTIPTPPVVTVSETKERSSSATEQDYAPEGVQASVQQPIRSSHSALRKRIEEVGDVLKASRVGRFFGRVFGRSNTDS
ncbi:hypothetical protein GYMLUDRAFT_246251 [Collybiopsis luxurians FD-317 M1]|uniref:Uncharacterized protein n=1 Tax=Collybiopsis luxurians FD-317 M1 TaxID=944289 RepID=A0A0D0B4J0_9AGAR|nr:hypothetical protein GYMLUDRAFT_246251 [Collybiopsis luxurians FD-317 M1]